MNMSPPKPERDFAEAVEGIRRGYEDVKAGRTRPAAEFLEDLRRKHGFAPISELSS